MELLPKPRDTKNRINAEYRERAIRDAEEAARVLRSGSVGDGGDGVDGSIMLSCRFYQQRKRRYCPRKPLSGQTVCSLHTEEALRESRIASIRTQCKHALDLMIEEIVRRLEKNMEGEVRGEQERSAKKRKRISAPKRMANPFSAHLSPDIKAPDWSRIFGDPSRPLTIDIGCARGLLVEKMASRNEGENFLGIELRPELVTEALERNSSRKHQNLHYIACNINVSAKVILGSLPPGTLHLMTINFPSPWRKKKKRRRRILQDELVNTLSQHMGASTRIYCCSDVEDVCKDMHDKLAMHPCLEGGWVEEPPHPEYLSERDLECQRTWRKVWRCSFTRKKED